MKNNKMEDARCFIENEQIDGCFKVTITAKDENDIVLGMHEYIKHIEKNKNSTTICRFHSCNAKALHGRVGCREHDQLIVQ